MSTDPAAEASSRPAAPARRSHLAFWVVGVLIVLVASIAAAKALRVEHVAEGHASESFVVACDFAKFRQIMVRKNATSAIVGHSGMRLLGEEVEAVALDLSDDDRPILNAIRGRSKSDLAATKQITVQLDDPTLEADRLVLRQNADIEQTRMNVHTESIAAAGRLLNYKTTLNAVPEGANTRLQISVDMQVSVDVFLPFAHVADKRVQEAADEAIEGQQAAIGQFIAEHASKALILPELGR
ncbi:MAG: hypothetical protein ACO1RT_12805 [Planctomycetaceae bacterium]